jgi:uncharacterized protein
MKESKPLVSFDSFDGEHFIYLQKDGSIRRLNKPLTLIFTGPEHKTHFAVTDRENIRKAINEELELLVLNVTDSCNLRCQYCIFSGNYNGEPTYGDSIMQLPVATKAIDYLFTHSENSKQRILSFYGGETLQEKTKEVLQGATSYSNVKSLEEKKPIRFALTTNGTNLEDWAQWLVDNKVMAFVSLDGPEHVQDKLRGKGTFGRILRGLERIQGINEEYFNQDVAFSSTFANADDLENIKEFFARHYVHNRVRISGIKTSGIKKESPLKRIINYGQIKQKFEQFAIEYTNAISSGECPDKFLKGLFDQVLMKIFYRSKDTLSEPCWPTNTCIPGGKKLFVKEDGRFYPCDKVYGEDFEIGDIWSGVNIEKVNSLLEAYINNCNSRIYLVV